MMYDINEPIKKDDPLSVKVEKTYGGATKIGVGSSVSRDAILLLVKKVDELEAEIKLLKNN